MPLTESKIEARVVRYCRERGLYTRKFASPAHRGVPDRIIAGYGRVLFLELKRPGNTPTALQQREIAELTRHSLVAKWCDSFEQAKYLIEERFFSTQCRCVPSPYQIDPTNII